jgi:hypothetical protein
MTEQESLRITYVIGRWGQSWLNLESEILMSKVLQIAFALGGAFIFGRIYREFYPHPGTFSVIELMGALLCGGICGAIGFEIGGFFDGNTEKRDDEQVANHASSISSAEPSKPESQGSEETIAEPSEQECPWCEKSIVPDEDSRCPACERPI